MSQIQDHPTNPRRKLTADYYPLVARALASLGDDSREARDAVYDRARKALMRHLSSLDPPLSGAELAAELWALDNAIAQLEAEALPSRVARVQAKSAAARGAPVTPPPSPPHEPARGEPAWREPVAIRPATSPAAQNPLLRVALPALAASAVIWTVLIYLGPFYDPQTPAASNVFGVVLWTAVSTLLVTSAVAAWYRRKRCREAGLVAHRHPAFARHSVSADARRQVAEGMSEEELFWAHFLPEHTSDAKEIIREELQRRGCSQAQLDQWAPDPAGVTVPSVLDQPMSVESYMKLVKARMWAFYSYLVVLTLLTALLAYIIYDLISIGQAHNIKLTAAVLGAVMLALAAAASLPFRNRLLRVLLLRPFGERKLTRALKQFVRKNTGRIGNVFTLSDRNYKPNLLITILWRIPAEGLDLLVIFLLGPLLGHSKRIASVKSERKFRKLERHLLRRYSPAFWSFMSGHQAFNIRSSDSWWQMCIHMLMHSCDVILVDLSKVKEGTGWEIRQLRARNLMDKCVFIIGEEHIADIGPVLEEHFDAADPPKIHVYRNDGKPCDQSVFEARFGPIMAAGLARWGKTT